MIRLFEEDDLDYICSCVTEHFQDCPNGWGFGSPPQRENVEDFLVDHMLNSTGIIVVRGGKRQGFLTFKLIEDQPEYPDAKILSATHWFVSQEFRNGRAGLELLDGAKNIAKATGCTHLVITLAKTSPVEENTMIRLGLELSNFVYIGEV